ncbi:MAG: ABC-type phosphate transport system permease component [Candidatus Scalindua rubra]|uniref:Phosphate transport system permease protein n=1 Tax=Candidatus Scalindua rubra TaxID=1872076 RepID=A0A1E3X6Z3_9BACT|nr:MAG: ABC-type phosphate transport system permease component [Candidatus Scalindua rubra]
MKLTRVKEKVIHFFFFLAGISAIIILLGIFSMLLFNGIKTFKDISAFNFFFSTVWNPTAYEEPSYGILSMVVSTFMVILGSMVIAVPLGIGTVAYITEVAGHRTQEILKPIIEILAAIPSVVIGFLGIIFVGPLIAKVFNLTSGLNAINGSILLAVMSLPTIISISEDAIRVVPKEYKEASYALGANRWTTLIRVTIPAAISGIVASIMLGIGRAIGETMTVLMATGNAPAMPHSFFDSIRTMTATIAIELGEVPYGTTHYYAIFAVGTILFLMSLSVNIIAELVTAKYRTQ